MQIFDLSPEAFYLRNLFRNPRLVFKPISIWDKFRLVFSHPVTRAVCVLLLLVFRLLEYAFDDVDLYVDKVKAKCTDSNKTTDGLDMATDSFFFNWMFGVFAIVSPIATKYTFGKIIESIVAVILVLTMSLLVSPFILRPWVYVRVLRLRRSGALYLPSEGDASCVDSSVVPDSEDDIPAHLRGSWSSGLIYQIVAGLLWIMWFVGVCFAGFSLGRLGCSCFPGGTPCQFTSGDWIFSYTFGLVVTMTLTVYTFFCVLSDMYSQAQWYPLTVEWPSYLKACFSSDPPIENVSCSTMEREDSGRNTTKEGINEQKTNFNVNTENFSAQNRRAVVTDAAAIPGTDEGGTQDRDDRSNTDEGSTTHCCCFSSRQCLQLKRYLGKPAGRPASPLGIAGGDTPCESVNAAVLAGISVATWIFTIATLIACSAAPQKLRSWGISLQKHGTSSSKGEYTHGPIYAGMSVLFAGIVLIQDWRAPNYQWPPLPMPGMPCFKNNSGLLLWIIIPITIVMDIRFVYQTRENAARTGEVIIAVILIAVAAVLMVSSIARSSLWYVKYFGPKK